MKIFVAGEFLNFRIAFAIYRADFFRICLIPLPSRTSAHSMSWYIHVVLATIAEGTETQTGIKQYQK